MQRIPAILIAGLACFWSVQAGGKADSIVYETQNMQWNVFPCKQPVKAFSLDGSQLWFADGELITSLNVKKMKQATYQSIGQVPAANVTSIAGDGAGNVYFGSDMGVVLSGAKGTKQYTTSEGLADNAIVALCIAKNGKLWAATAKGVSCLQGGSWKTYSAGSGLISENVSCMTADNMGRMWFGTDKGISCYDGSTWKSYTAKNGMSWNEVKALGYDNKAGTLWAAVGESDVNSFNGKEWNVFMSIQSGIKAIMGDTQSRIWFGYEGGLVKYNGEEWISEPGRIGITASQVSQLFCDGQGNLWFGSDKGVIRLANPYPY